MVDVVALGNSIETRKDLGTDNPDAARYAYWMAQEAIAEKEERKWIKQAREIIKRYRDERPEAIQGTNRFNILWSNVQTLIPTLYARTPKPDVQRRFIDPDPTGRLASILLERSLAYSADAFAFDDVMKAVVQDRLLPGRGVARVLYVPHFGETIDDEKKPGGQSDEGVADDDGDEDDDNEEFEDRENAASTVAGAGDADEDADEKEDAAAGKNKPREVTYEEVTAKYVFWEDYREGPARQWVEVPWVRYQSYLTRDQLCERFGKAKAKKVNLDYTPKGMAESVKHEPPPDLYKKAIVREYWDKARKEAVWLAPGTPDLILDTKDDPLELPDFFPNPDPLLSTTTNDKRIPVPDYIEYQDQARELDSLTARIDKLTRALKVSGVYAGEEKQVLQQLVDEGTENKLIPVGDWTAWSDKGGMKTFIEWLPIKQVAETLIQLYNARDRVKQILYEITGLSDILRGATMPEETLGAQQLKANFATRRISPQQKEAARFARDMFRLMGAVIAVHFDAKTISLITGYPQLDPVPQLPPQPQMPPQVMLAMIMQQHAQQGMAAAPSSQAPAGGAAPALNGGAPAVSPAGPAAPQPPQMDPQIQQQMQAFQQATAQWKQAAQAVQAIQQKNAQKQQQFDAAVALIKNDGPHGFRIDIEADSTIAPDEQAEKQSRVEFLQQFIPLLGQVVPLAQGNPPLAALAKEITLFACRGFRVARVMEETIEQAFEAIAKMQPNLKATGQDQKPQGPQGPHPAEIAADVAMKNKQIETDATLEGQRTQANAAMTAHAEDTKFKIAQLQAAVKSASDEADRRLKAIEIAGKQQNERQHLMLDIEKAAGDTARNNVLAAHRTSADAGRLE